MNSQFYLGLGIGCIFGSAMTIGVIYCLYLRYCRIMAGRVKDTEGIRKDYDETHAAMTRAANCQDWPRANMLAARCKELEELHAEILRG